MCLPRRPPQGANTGAVASPHYDKIEQPEQPAANPYSSLVLGADLYTNQSGEDLGGEGDASQGGRPYDEVERPGAATKVRAITNAPFTMHGESRTLCAHAPLLTQLRNRPKLSLWSFYCCRTAISGRAGAGW